MIFVKGYGQMCNNILQYAHAYAFGREYGVKVISMRFAYKYRFFAICREKFHTPLVYLFAKFMIKARLIKCFWLETPETVTPQVLEELKTKKFIALDGWHFRFPHLFMKYRSEILAQFSFKENIIAARKELLSSLPEYDIRLGVHIRRGDYANWMGGKFFFDDTVYINKINQFRALFPGKRVQVLICTNDRHLDIAKYRSSVHEDVHLSDGNMAEDLYTLSECDYLIGPKSTYSLMAAFYHDRPLHWIMDKDRPLTMEEFTLFENLFMTV